MNEEEIFEEVIDEDDYYFDEEDEYFLNEDEDDDYEEDDEECSEYERKMDKLNQIICFFLSAVIFLSILAPVICYFPKEKFSNFIDYGDYNGVIINDCGASNIYLRKLDKEMNKVPEFIRDDFFENGGEIHVVDYLSNEGSYVSDDLRVVGQYNPMTGNIYMLYDFDNIDSICHEFGHYFDVSNQIIDSRFVEIYNSESQPFLDHVINSTYFTDHTREFFAEGFNQLIHNPDRLAKACPELSKYIQQKINFYQKLNNEK